jgi:hypothetical protein
MSHISACRTRYLCTDNLLHVLQISILCNRLRFNWLWQNCYAKVWHRHLFINIPANTLWVGLAWLGQYQCSGSLICLTSPCGYILGHVLKLWSSDSKSRSFSTTKTQHRLSSTQELKVLESDKKIKQNWALNQRENVTFEDIYCAVETWGLSISWLHSIYLYPNIRWITWQLLVLQTEIY